MLTAAVLHATLSGMEWEGTTRKSLNESCRSRYYTGAMHALMIIVTTRFIVRIERSVIHVLPCFMTGSCTAPKQARPDA